MSLTIFDANNPGGYGYLGLAVYRKLFGSP